MTLGSAIQAGAMVGIEESSRQLAEFTASLRSKFILNNRVLLVQAPQFLFNAFNVEVAKRRGYYAYPPTGLQSLAKVLEGRGLEVDILDLNFEVLKRVNQDPSFDFHDWLGILEEWLKAKKPSIVGVTTINVYSDVFAPGYPFTEVMGYLRDRGEHIILAGGPIAMNEYRNYLSRGYCHVIADGECENKINVIFDYLYDKDPKAELIGGIYFNHEGELRETAGMRDVVRLSGNLVDTYDKIPIEEYNSVGSLNPFSRMAGIDRRFAAFHFVRGCRANCAFCGVRDFMGKGTRHFPVADLLEEIDYLVTKRGVRHFDVLDDDFLRDREAVAQLLKGMVKYREEYGITWSSNNGLIGASITDEIMRLMRDSGCIGFRIGVESGNPQQLKRLRKPGTVASLKKTAEIMNKYPEVMNGGNYILGILGEETFGQIMETFRFSCELDTDWSSFAVFQFTHNERDKAVSPQERKVAGDFVPSKSSSELNISSADGVVSGPSVFDLPDDIIPSPEQLNQIWFAFNLVGNYLNNKNLRPGGWSGKYTKWIEAVMMAYPANPYMPLFAGIGRVVMGDRVKAVEHLQECRRLIEGSDYWKSRFTQYDLMSLVENFPLDKEAALTAVGSLRERYVKYLPNV